MQVNPVVTGVKLDVQYGAKRCAPIWVLGDNGKREKMRERE